MKVLGIVILVLALATAILPQYTACDTPIQLANGTTVPMKCNWTAKAEIAVAVPLLAVGAMLATSRRKETKRNTAVMGVVLGVFAMALPTYLIGVCSTNHLCNTVMKPSLLVFGSVITAGSLGALVMAQRSKEPLA